MQEIFSLCLGISASSFLSIALIHGQHGVLGFWGFGVLCVVVCLFRFGFGFCFCYSCFFVCCFAYSSSLSPKKLFGSLRYLIQAFGSFASLQSFQARAIYAYEPANDDELQLFEDDEVLVTLCRDDGWYQGTNLATNMGGLFPGNYVEKIEGSDTNQTNYYEREKGFSDDAMPPEPKYEAAAPPAAAPVVDPLPSETEKKVSEPAAVPAPAKKKGRPRREKSTLKYAYWAQNVGIFASACALLLGAMNFIWWSGFFQFDKDWPIQNKKVKSIFNSQSVYGMGKKGLGFFPDKNSITYVDDANQLKVGEKTYGTFEEFKQQVYENNPVPSDPFVSGSIRKMAGYYDSKDDSESGIFIFISAFIGPYTMLIGAIFLFAECCCTVKRPKTSCLYKSKCDCLGILYILVSIPMFAAVPTCLVGLMYVLASVPHFLTTKNKEYGSDTICCGARGGGKSHWTENPLLKKDTSCRQKWIETCDGVRRGNQVGVCVFGIIWVLLNVAIGLQRLFYMIAIYRCSLFEIDGKPWGVEVVNQDTKRSEDFIKECCLEAGDYQTFTNPIAPGDKAVKGSCSNDLYDPYKANFIGFVDKQTMEPTLRIEVSFWVGIAKVFGQLLNLNCAFVLLPVARTFIGFVSNRLLNTRGSLAGIIPIQKNITFHKLIAKSILFFAAAHTVSHFIGIAEKPIGYYDNLQLSPWVTGYVIILAQFFIYSAATDVVRRALFRVFWLNHHWFVVFFGGLLIHGWEFWIWFLVISGPLYVAERVGRLCRGNKPFFVKRIKWIPPVMEVQFCPLQKSDFEFKEGQYLFVFAGEFSGLSFFFHACACVDEPVDVTVSRVLCVNVSMIAYVGRRLFALLFGCFHYISLWWCVGT